MSLTWFKKLVKLQQWMRKRDRGTLTRPHHIAHRILGSKTRRFLPLFTDMDDNLRKSGMLVSFAPYVSLTLLTSLVVSLVALLVIPIVAYLILQIALLQSLLFTTGGALLAGALTVIFFYIYPIYRADKAKRDLESNLTFAASYLAILAGAGVPIHEMFRSLSNISQDTTVVRESRLIVRDIDLFGADVITSLENASYRTPSEQFKELLEGFIATIRSGGNLASFLVERSKQHMKSEKITLKKFLDTLGILSESYVALLVAGPLIFVVMLGVMGVFGGIGPGMLNPSLLVMLLTYIGIPVGSIVFLVILDALAPE